MMNELSAMLQPEYIWLDAVGFFGFLVFVLWTIITGKSRATVQKKKPDIIQRAA